MFIPAHAEPTAHIAPPAQKNIDKALEIGDRIVALCRAPAGFGQILKGLFDAYGLAMTFEKHILAGSTARSYLTRLQEKGRIQPLIENNAWRRKA